MAEQASKGAEDVAQDVADRAKPTADDVSQQIESGADDVADKARSSAKDASKAVKVSLPSCHGHPRQSQVMLVAIRLALIATCIKVNCYG